MLGPREGGAGRLGTEELGGQGGAGEGKSAARSLAAGERGKGQQRKCVRGVSGDAPPESSELSG